MAHPFTFRLITSSPAPNSSITNKEVLPSQVKFILLVALVIGQVDKTSANSGLSSNKPDFTTTTIVHSRSGINLDTTPGDDLVQISQFGLQSEIDFSFKQSFDVFGSVRFRHHAEENKINHTDHNGYQESTRPIQLNNGNQLELREFYLDYTNGKHYLRLGKQQVVWGKSDGLKLLDVVNPQNFSEFILEDFDNARIPLWMALYELNLDIGELQFLFIPDSSVHSLALAGSPYEISAPRFLPNLGYFLSTYPNTQIQLNEVYYPTNALENHDFGFRWRHFLNGWDLSLNYLNHTDDLPAFYSRQSTVDELNILTIQPIYERTEIYGGSASTALAEFTIRSELAFTKGQHFQTPASPISHGVIHRDELSYVLGLDWFGLSNTLISMQLFQSHIIDISQDIERNDTETTLTFLARKNWLNETLSIESLLIQNLSQHDGLVRSKLNYRFSDALSLSIQADIFHGDATGIFGQFENNDRVLLSIEYHI